MQKVLVDRYARIVNGILKGYEGFVISFDNLKDKVCIELDKETTVIVTSDNIKQEIGTVQITCVCGCIYDVKETENDGENYCHFCNEKY